jgi:D-amino-acid oxidase
MADHSLVNPARRTLLVGAAALLAMPALIGRARAQEAPLRGGELLPSPNFGTARRLVAGVRPYRRDGVNLSTERRADDFVILHNYGHGGAGITLSWGCAADVLQRFRRLEGSAAFRSTKPIAIIGSGVSGLTVAAELRAAYPRRRIVMYSKDRLEDTTSYKAGGQFAPSSISHTYQEQGRLPELHRLVRASFAKLQNLRQRRAARTYGIVERYNYSFSRNEAYDVGCPCDVVADPRHGALPFDNLHGRMGWEYRSWLMNPTLMLPAIRADLRRAGRLEFRRREITDIAALRREHAIVINCSGLGSRTLFNDATMTPIKGQLVLLAADPERPVRYMFSERCTIMGAQATYLFGRQNDIVVGGTYQAGVDDTVAVSADCNAFIDRMNNIFNGSVAVCRPPADGPVVARCPAVTAAVPG